MKRGDIWTVSGGDHYAFLNSRSAFESDAWATKTCYVSIELFSYFSD